MTTFIGERMADIPPNTAVHHRPSTCDVFFENTIDLTRSGLYVVQQGLESQEGSVTFTRLRDFTLQRALEYLRLQCDYDPERHCLSFFTQDSEGRSQRIYIWCEQQWTLSFKFYGLKMKYIIAEKPESETRKRKLDTSWAEENRASNLRCPERTARDAAPDVGSGSEERLSQHRGSMLVLPNDRSVLPAHAESSYAEGALGDDSSSVASEGSENSHLEVSRARWPHDRDLGVARPQKAFRPKALTPTRRSSRIRDKRHKKRQPNDNSPFIYEFHPGRSVRIRQNHSCSGDHRSGSGARGEAERSSSEHSVHNRQLDEETPATISTTNIADNHNSGAGDTSTTSGRRPRTVHMDSQVPDQDQVDENERTSPENQQDAALQRADHLTLDTSSCGAIDVNGASRKHNFILIESSPVLIPRQPDGISSEERTSGNSRGQ
ncbi:hypothetical protein BDV12DRAFT_204778 [Aspergillus spectabilis]